MGFAFIGIYFFFSLVHACLYIVSAGLVLALSSRTGMQFRAATLGLSMANSKFQYVKKFELPDVLLPDTYLVTRLDGHRFTKFTAEHGFTKPNDERGLLLMAEVGCDATHGNVLVLPIVERASW